MAVEKHHASLLVVGSHGYGAIKRFFEFQYLFRCLFHCIVAVSGGVSDYCANYAHCSLLIGSKLQHVERNHPANSWKFNIHGKTLDIFMKTG
ncbi:hypothetical protein OROMI_005039 [Orobanche minor]